MVTNYAKRRVKLRIEGAKFPFVLIVFCNRAVLLFNFFVKNSVKIFLTNSFYCTFVDTLIRQCKIKTFLIQFFLRVPFCKNQTNFKFRGKGRKFDFAHILIIDSQGYDKNYWIVFLAKYPYISKKYANYHSPLKSSLDAPFY